MEKIIPNHRNLALIAMWFACITLPAQADENRAPPDLARDNLAIHDLATKPVQVFILAGQSNMEGQAVVDLAGKDYNFRKGTLTKLMEDPAKLPLFAHLRSSDGNWIVRDDVFVRYQREGRPLLTGPLTFGFSVYGDVHHFGPELQFGHVVGDHFEKPSATHQDGLGGQKFVPRFSTTVVGW